MPNCLDTVVCLLYVQLSWSDLRLPLDFTSALSSKIVAGSAALVVFHLRSFFSRPRTEHGLMDGTCCKLMIMIYCVVILYVFLFETLLCVERSGHEGF